MSFNTPVTPGILATASCAARRSSSLRTLPLRVTYPSVEETKICLSLVTGFARNAAFACAITLRSLVVFRAVTVASKRPSWSASFRVEDEVVGKRIVPVHVVQEPHTRRALVVRSPHVVERRLRGEP